MPDEKLGKLIRDTRNKIIPTSEDLIKETFLDLGYLPQKETLNGITGIDPHDALNNFNDMLKKVFTHSLVVLERYEDSLYIDSIVPSICSLRSDIIRQIKNNDPIEFTNIALQKLYPDLWQMMLSRSQSRKQRGGKDWEYEIAGMLNLIQISYDMQTIKDRSDFKIPSEKAFLNDRTKTFLLSAKRSLRERWKQVAQELQATRASNVFLATAEEPENLPKHKVDEIWEFGVHLLVWDETKAKYPDHPGIVSFSEFAKRDIPAFRNYWILK